ncbi:hypothetical protein DNL40_01600 [Xylanimonas oleitrophica]|uniref:Uncharacterized protein n=1 Tax=Xylanimonas oleitrophica TaxID=2607479 RepID=A0A2W5X3W1_9MICO|nr:hypothetical protein [Xylanimonas oleitrophica]PZR55105.1 hypothetical protein DNL40_01600 [Xylanimonas oleitrophica]
MRGDLHLSALLARLGLFSGPLPRPPAAAAAAAAVPDDVARGLEGASPAARRSVLDPLGLRAAGERARSAGRSPAVLPHLDGARPVPARQVDETTCGSAVLTMLALAADPRLALEVARDPGPRFAALQHRVLRRTSVAGPVPWPRRYGTPPWAAARVARFGPRDRSVRYTHRVVGRGASGRAVLCAAVAAAAAGVPVPLYSGGSLRQGWQAAVPRHVVLLVGVDAGTGALRLYEPSSGTVHGVPAGVFLAPASAAPGARAALTVALGGWPHVVWALLPR